ncbi:WD40 repeat domain-containing protein [Streptomyces sp. AGS-58]|uniref:WD40 repeat domain-containing protein n=1 Tax=unclassified Streptomyces TaxID=2593676 RepID=UPI0035A3C158
MIDALDETVSTEQARLTVTRIVLPLVETCSDVGIRVLVATRPRDDEGNLLSTFGPAAEIIDLDSSEFFESADLAAYAEATLRLLGDERPANPYLDAEVAGPIALRIAELSERNFLVAGLVARTHGLYDAAAIAPQDVSFTPTVEAALRNYLQRLPNVGDVKADIALSALAFAEAPGFSLDLWKTAIAAISGTDLTVSAVKHFARSSAANFLIETSSVGEVSQYRLFHQALNDALISGRAEVSSREEDERAIARSFMAEGRSARWQDCPPYLLRSLPYHAHRGGILDEMLLDDEYLLYGDLRRLIPLADGSASKDTRHRAQLLRKVPEAINADPATRVSLFSVTELQERLGKSFKEYKADAPYRAEWTTVAPRSEEVTLEGHTGGVGALCAVKAGGRQLLASGSENGNLRLSDPSSGETIRVLEGHSGSVIALSSLQVGGRTLLASATTEAPSRRFNSSVNEVWLWEPTMGIRVGVLNDQEEELTDAFALCSVRVGEDDLLAMAHFSGRVSIWDPISGRHLRTITSVHWVESICTASTGKRELLVCSEEGDVSLVDPVSGSVTRTWRHADSGDVNDDYFDQGDVNAIAQVVVDGVRCLVSASLHGVFIRALGSGEVIRELETTGRSVRGLCAVSDQNCDLIAGFCDEDIFLWDASTGRIIRKLKGHTQDVLALCSIQVGQRIMLASSGVDNSVRLWDPRAAIGHTLSELSNGVYSVHNFMLSSRPSVLTCEYNGSIRLRSVKTGNTARLVQNYPQDVLSVLGKRVAGRPAIITGGFDGIVRMRDPFGLDAPQPVFTSHTGPVVAISAIDIFDWSLVVSADKHGTIFVWDPVSREIVLRFEDWYDEVYGVGDVVNGVDPLIACAGHTSSNGSLITVDPISGEIVRKFSARRGWVSCLTTFRVGENSFVATGGEDAIIRIWDAASGKAVATLEGHTGSVTALAIVRSGRRLILASGGGDRTVRLWDPLMGRRLLEVPVYHPVTSVAQVGKSLVIGSSAGVLSLAINWQAPKIAQ